MDQPTPAVATTGLLDMWSATLKCITASSPKSHWANILLQGLLDGMLDAGSRGAIQSQDIIEVKDVSGAPLRVSTTQYQKKNLRRGGLITVSLFRRSADGMTWSFVTDGASSVGLVPCSSVRAVLPRVCSGEGPRLRYQHGGGAAVCEGRSSLHWHRPGSCLQVGAAGHHGGHPYGPYPGGSLTVGPTQGERVTRARLPHFGTCCMALQQLQHYGML